jgi:hypothetical protein
VHRISPFEGMTFTHYLILPESVASTFDKDPELTMTFEVACHISGHYEAGMRAHRSRAVEPTTKTL